MIEVSLRDRAFAHAVALGAGDKKFFPEKLRFNRDPQVWLDVCIFTDDCIVNGSVQHSRSRQNIAWLLEPMAVSERPYLKVLADLSVWDAVLTHDLALMAMAPEKIHFVPFGGCWIDHDRRKVWEKTKNISVIASGKRQTIGHRLRHQIIEELAPEFDLICGRGYRPISDKIEALQEFRYSVVVENDDRPIWFTEKLIDCFVTGTLPIYWGPDLSDFFNMEGILRFRDIHELRALLKEATPALYEARRSAIEDNFQRSAAYGCPEDWLATHLLTAS
jgi:hypothetical protein